MRFKILIKSMIPIHFEQMNGNCMVSSGAFLVKIKPLSLTKMLILSVHACTFYYEEASKLDGSAFDL